VAEPRKCFAVQKRYFTAGADQNFRDVHRHPDYASEWLASWNTDKHEETEGIFPAAPEVMTSYSFPGLVAQNGSKKRERRFPGGLIHGRFLRSQEFLLQKRAILRNAVRIRNG